MLQKELQQHYGDNVYYLPNGVDEDEFSYWERNIKEPFSACYVGKNTERKGYVQYIVEACRRAEVPLRSQVCRFNSPNVIQHADMPNHYNGADVILIASDMDGTPNQLLEGASRGRTFVGNAIGNVPEFVDNNVNGFLVERNVNSYVERLNWLKGHREECKEMGLAARKTIEEGWTWKIQAENYRKMFREALG
jgi:glycosyltransferase involved in cell wall biosynthesis